MLIESKRLITGVTTDRRALLRGVGTIGLSAAAVAVLGGCESMAANSSASAADVDILRCLRWQRGRQRRWARSRLSISIHFRMVPRQEPA